MDCWGPVISVAKSSFVYSRNRYNYSTPHILVISEDILNPCFGSVNLTLLHTTTQHHHSTNPANRTSNDSYNHLPNRVFFLRGCFMDSSLDVTTALEIGDKWSVRMPNMCLLAPEEHIIMVHTPFVIHPE